ncbi:MAG: CocE/NonD family hydrolase [Pseudomonadota bacterium]
MNLIKTATIAMFMSLGFACSSDPTQEESPNKKSDPSKVMDTPLDAPTRVSEFGRYEGYSQPVYDEYIRSSVYVPMRDGVKIAVDIYRPAIDGVAVETPLPVLLRYSRYWRAKELSDGSIQGRLGTIPPGKSGGKLNWSFKESKHGDTYLSSDGFHGDSYIVSHGYITAWAESRGTGASQGHYDGGQSAQEARDGYDLIEWLAAQNFSSGKVGMLGPSYAGQIQYAILGNTPPPSLKACFASVAFFDDFQSWSSGVGVLRKSIINWVNDQLINDGIASSTQKKKVARVDEDLDGAILAAAISDRRTDAGPNAILKENFRWSPETKLFLNTLRETLKIESNVDLVRFAYGPTNIIAEALEKHPKLRDGLLKATFEGYREDYLGDTYLAGDLPNINKSKVPIYHWGGWRDAYTDSTTLWYVNIKNKKKLTLGPWGHYPATDTPRNNAYIVLKTIEQLRWFDHFLKGIDNGVMDESPVSYAIAHSEKEWEWRNATEWPVPESSLKPFYFSTNQSNTIQSVNDGTLTTTAPTKKSKDAFVVDYATTIGKGDRYYNTIGLPYAMPDLVSHAFTALTYTTAPLETDLLIAGHPIVRLQASSTETDGDFIVYLEEVDADGTVHLLSDGLMRASYRILGDPPYDYLNLPWSKGTADAVAATAPLNTETASLAFALKPIANRFEKGNRIRVVITGADADGTLLIPITPAPTQEIVIGGVSPSLIELPILNSF